MFMSKPQVRVYNWLGEKAVHNFQLHCHWSLKSVECAVTRSLLTALVSPSPFLSLYLSLSPFFNFVRENELRVVQKRPPLCSWKWEFGWPYGFLWPSLAIRTVYIQCIFQSACLACTSMPRCTALHRRTCRSQNHLGVLLWNYRRVVSVTTSLARGQRKNKEEGSSFFVCCFVRLCFHKVLAVSFCRACP